MQQTVSLAEIFKVNKCNKKVFVLQESSAPEMETISEVDPELAKYLDRHYWEHKRDKAKSSPSAPSSEEKSENEAIKNANSSPPAVKTTQEVMISEYRK